MKILVLLMLSLMERQDRDIQLVIQNGRQAEEGAREI